MSDAPDAASPAGRRWMCVVCMYVYDPAKGDPEAGIPPGTAFEDLPEGWICPACRAKKKAFRPLKT